MIEFRAKQKSGYSHNDWKLLNSHINFEDLNMDFFSIRINKDREYHTLNTPGFEEAYNREIVWMRLADVKGGDPW